MKRPWRRKLRYAIGGAMLVLLIVAARAGLQWYWCLVNLCVAVLVLIGRRRIFRVGVSRTGDEIICRYVPWYEGNAYFLNVAFPLMGVAMIAAGFSPGNPVWLRFGGPILLFVTAISVFGTVRMWRRCYLRIAPSALTVRLAAPKDGPIVLGRDFVESVSPKIVPNGVSGQSLQVEIAYRQTGSGDIQTVVLGLQLTVKPINLLNAIAYWEDGSAADPTLLMDRIDRILRGRVTAGV